ncbi:ferredoxin reductase family protein [Agarivorans litoreus]|uniref:ferredoxin reductase family protein n=1 Tax=Agarivorans litoreus TaxID=1510455 RepID=UPI001C7D4C57|nr:ferric reductase-like transmembrane domain-containing protein [Agarivorans litoreus]
MRKTTATIILLLAAITGLWLQAEPNLFSSDNFFQWRSALIQYSGMLAVGLMSITMLLALRLPFIELLTKGLDKSYRLHKHLGIASVLVAVVHWLLAIIPKQLVRAGILDKPVRGAGPNNSDSLYALVRPLRGLAEQVGEVAFYSFVVLAVVALVGVIRYKEFRYSHKLMSLAFLALAFHSAILIKHSYWPYPITYACLALIWVGSVAAVYSLFGRIGKTKQHTATVANFRFLPQDKVVDLRLSVPNWHGHNSGQFAFIGFPGEEPHPFTIASTNTNTGQVRFLIKELGDFTASLKSRLNIGQDLKVEGPYGHFDFNDSAAQLWIAGGIGIAAFTAILQQRQTMNNPPKAILYYCSDTLEPKLIEELQQLSQSSEVELRIIDNSRQALLSAEQLVNEVADLMQRKIWFCGPVAFSSNLQQQLAHYGYPLKHFHSELFELR